MHSIHSGQVQRGGVWAAASPPAPAPHTHEPTLRSGRVMRRVSCCTAMSLGSSHASWDLGWQSHTAKLKKDICISKPKRAEAHALCHTSARRES